jgi:hypothetical protein
MAMDDLDAVRTALGYRQLDLIGSSYGATAARSSDDFLGDRQAPSSSPRRRGHGSAAG